MLTPYASSVRRTFLFALFGLLLLAASARAEGVAAARIYTRGGETFQLYLDGNLVGSANTSFRLPSLTGGYHWLEFRFPNRRLPQGVVGYRVQAWFAPDFESTYELDAFPRGGRMTFTRVSYAALGGSGYADSYSNQQPPQYQTGYAPPTGSCQSLMTPAEVDQLIATLKGRDYESTRLSMAKDVVSHGTIMSADVKRIMGVFDYESSRLDFAKYAYNRCCDQRNYYTVNDAFEYDSSVRSLQAHTRGGR